VTRAGSCSPHLSFCDCGIHALLSVHGTLLVARPDCGLFRFAGVTVYDHYYSTISNYCLPFKTVTYAIQPLSLAVYLSPPLFVFGPCSISTVALPTFFFTCPIFECIILADMSDIAD
jgi:hypothetical protein